MTSLTCSFQNVSYSRPISRNLMEGHCLLIKRSPGQYMYIIYLTFFFNKRRITITNNFYIWSISLLGYMYAEIYGKHKFIQIIFLIWRQSFVTQIIENSLIRGFPKFEPFCCVFSVICYKMKIGRIIRGGDVYLFYI